MKNLTKLAALLGGALALSDTVHAQQSLTLLGESVSDYTLISGGSHVNDTDCNTEMSGFITGMGSPYGSGIIWFEDADVWDRDFLDPELTGNPADDDSQGFDHAGVGISYVCAHGVCDDKTNVPCVSDAQCSGIGWCPNVPVPTGSMRACVTNSTPRTIVTSSNSSAHSNLAHYGATTNNIGYGEDTSSGGFAGAGTNGGANISIITNSCGSHARTLGAELGRANAGTHTLMMHSPVGNLYNANFAGNNTKSFFTDTSQWAARGSTLANFIMTNLNSPSRTAWLNPSMASNNYLTVNGTTTAPLGVDIALTCAVNATAAQNLLTVDTWNQSTLESHDRTSFAGCYAYSNCNFTNCSSFLY